MNLLEWLRAQENSLPVYKRRVEEGPGGHLGGGSGRGEGRGRAPSSLPAQPEASRAACYRGLWGFLTLAHPSHLSPAPPPSPLEGGVALKVPAYPARLSGHQPPPGSQPESPHQDERGSCHPGNPMEFRSLVPGARGRDQSIYVFYCLICPFSPFSSVLVFVCSIECRKGLIWLAVRGEDCAVASVCGSALRVSGGAACARLAGAPAPSRRPARCGLSGVGRLPPSSPRALSGAPGLPGCSHCHLSLESSNSNKKTYGDCGVGGMEASGAACGGLVAGCWLCAGRSDRLSVRACPAAADLPPVKSPFLCVPL